MTLIVAHDGDVQAWPLPHLRRGAIFDMKIRFVVLLASRLTRTGWPEQVCALLEGWAAQYPDYADVESIGQTYERLPYT